jgi:hypothetical protein
VALDRRCGPDCDGDRQSEPVQLARERQFFDPHLNLSNLPNPLPISAVWSALFSPWPPPPAWLPNNEMPFTRTLFFGGPFAVLCLVGCVQFARRRADLVLVVVASAVMLFTSALTVSVASARFHFRDPLTLAAIPLAGLAVDHLLATRRSRAIGGLVLIAQVSVVLMSAWPALKRTWEPEALQAMWFRGATGAREPVDRLLQLMPTAGRLVLSPRVDYEVDERARLPEGLGVNALAYRGISVLNGRFKGRVDRNGLARSGPVLCTHPSAAVVCGVRCRPRRARRPVRARVSGRGGCARRASARPRAQARRSHLVLYENAIRGRTRS